MSSTFCDNYINPGTRNPAIWPAQPFPGNLFPGWNSKRRLTSQQAWAFFEQVEAADAATRVRLSGPGWTPPKTNVFAQDPSIWYSIQAEGAKVAYDLGRLLHQQACSGVNWQSQRSLGISPTPVTNVYPGAC